MNTQCLPDKIVLIYAIQEIATKPTGTGHYIIVPGLSVEQRNNGKYSFVVDFFSEQLYDMIEKIILKDLKIHQWKYILYENFTGITLTYDELQLVIDRIPNYIDDPKYSGKNFISEYIFTDIDKAKVKRNELVKPYKIKKLSDAIEDIEYLYNHINDLKDMLYDLEH